VVTSAALYARVSSGYVRYFERTACALPGARRGRCWRALARVERERDLAQLQLDGGRRASAPLHLLPARVKLLTCRGEGGAAVDSVTRSFLTQPSLAPPHSLR
jgi:hypothetical protein